MDFQPILFGVMLFVAGAVLGSFINVVIFRLPLDLSVVLPRSYCPRCGHPIRWYDNIPIASFFMLGRRCRDCRAPISWRYPLVELLCGLLPLALWWKFGFSWELAIHAAFCLALVAITFIDLDHRIIPNEVSLPGIAIAFACSFRCPGCWKESLLGLLVGGGLLLLLSFLYAWIRGREGMGMGDIKLLAMLGAWLGWRSLLFIALAASLQGVLAAIILWLAGVKLKPPLPEEWEEAENGGGQEPPPDAAAGSEGAAESEAKPEEPVPSFFGAAIPFGPFLALGAVEYLFLSQWFSQWLAGG